MSYAVKTSQLNACMIEMQRITSNEPDLEAGLANKFSCRSVKSTNERSETVQCGKERLRKTTLCKDCHALFKAAEVGDLQTPTQENEPSTETLWNSIKNYVSTHPNLAKCLAIGTGVLLLGSIIGGAVFAASGEVSESKAQGQGQNSSELTNSVSVIPVSLNPASVTPALITSAPIKPELEKPAPVNPKPSESKPVKPQPEKPAPVPATTIKPKQPATRIPAPAKPVELCPIEFDIQLTSNPDYLLDILLAFYDGNDAAKNLSISYHANMRQHPLNSSFHCQYPLPEIPTLHQGKLYLESSLVDRTDFVQSKIMPINPRENKTVKITYKQNTQTADSPTIEKIDCEAVKVFEDCRTTVFTGTRTMAIKKRN